MQARATHAPIAQKDLPRKIGGLSADRIIKDVKSIQVFLRGFHAGIRDGELGKCYGRDEQFTFSHSRLEAVSPGFPAGLSAGEKKEDRTIECCAHTIREEVYSEAQFTAPDCGGSSRGPRNSSMMSRVLMPAQGSDAALPN